MSSLRERTPSQIRERLHDATPEQQAIILAALQELKYDWLSIARESQLPPTGEWFVWLILAGRGWGKTLTGAEFAKAGSPQSLLNQPGARWAFIAETFADGRDTMIEGETGLLSRLPPSALKGGTPAVAYNRSLGELFLVNGSKVKLYSSERPAALRGPQHHGAWGDEPAKWKDAHKGEAEDTTWSNLLLGLRLGNDPRCVMTTTPRPNTLIRRLNTEASTVVTRGTTYENLANLSPTFREYVISRYEGTRLGQQELMAQILDDYLGALWSRQQIDEHRIILDGSPEDIIAELGIRKIFVGVDPSTFSPETGNDPGTIAQGTETGIVVVGIDAKPRPHCYVLADLSCRETGETWARRVTEAFHYWKASAVVPEMNMAGPLVLSTLRLTDPTVTIYKDKNGKPGVRAAQGKRARAEPVATLAEQGRLHHVGTFSPLEDVLCFPAGTMVATEWGGRAIEDVGSGDRVWTRQGLSPVAWSGETGETEALVRISHPLGSLLCTVSHPIWTSQGFVSARNVRRGMILLLDVAELGEVPMGEASISTVRQLHGGADGGHEPSRDTSRTVRPVGSFIGWSGWPITDQSPMVATSTTRTETPAIIDPRTWSPSPALITPLAMNPAGSDGGPPLNVGHHRNGTGMLGGIGRSSVSSAESGFSPGGCGRGIAHADAHGLAKAEPQQNRLSTEPVNTAGVRSSRPRPVLVSAPIVAVKRERVPRQPVFDLMIDGPHEFIADGVVVHNCGWDPSESWSPDRLDALVWAVTALEPWRGGRSATYGARNAQVQMIDLPKR